jgi:hypothetical protein
MNDLQAKIQQVLQDSHENPVKNSNKRRISNIAGLIFGMISTHSSHLSQISFFANNGIDAKSRETNAKRLLSSKWISPEEHYEPALKKVIGLLPCLGLGKIVHVIIDGTQIGKSHCCLMVSLSWNGRAIPLCWTVSKIVKGSFPKDAHVALVQHAHKILQTCLPSDTRIVLLGDGEFSGIALQSYCLSVGWDYVFRISKDTILYEDDDKFNPKTISPARGKKHFCVLDVGYTEKRFLTNYVCWHDSALHEEAIHLVTSLTSSILTSDSYNHRFGTECLFKDLKSSSFNLHKTRLKQASEIHILIMIASSAFLFLLLLSLNYLKKDNEKIVKKIIPVRKDKKIYSFFAFSLKLFAFLVCNNHSIFPQNSNNLCPIRADLDCVGF